MAKPNHATASTSKKKDTVDAASGQSPTHIGVIWTRVGIIALLAVVSFLTILFCERVYFDREHAFHSALECTERVLRERGVVHWLQNGTLLGSYRVGRLILWDADLDFGILRGSGPGEDFESVSSALDETCYVTHTRSPGVVNPSLAEWRKCTRRICSVFHETVLDEGKGMVVTGHGTSAVSELLPLKNCTVAKVAAFCPHNPLFYLADAFGSEWISTPFWKLF